MQVQYWACKRQYVKADEVSSGPSPTDRHAKWVASSCELGARQQTNWHSISCQQVGRPREHTSRVSTSRPAKAVRSKHLCKIKICTHVQIKQLQVREPWDWKNKINKWKYEIKEKYLRQRDCQLRRLRCDYSTCGH